MVKLRAVLSLIDFQKKHLLPFFVLIVFLTVTEAVIFFPRIFYASLGASLAAVFLAIWQFAYKNLSGKSYYNFLLLPLVFVLNLYTFLSIWPYESRLNMALLQAVLFSGGAFLFAYLRLAYFYFVKPYLYKENSFVNISSFGVFLAFYFAATSSYASISYGQFLFFNLPTWTISVFMIAVTALVTHQSFWSEKIAANFYYLLLVCLVVAELSWSMTFLPVSHYVNGLALSAAYYFISHLAKIKLAGGLTGAVIKRYLAFASIIILLIFLTGRWI